MVDFFIIATRPGKRGTIEIYPKFIIKKSSDLMIRGGDFYAIWLKDKQRWSTDEQDVIHLIDDELDKFAKENKDKLDGRVNVLHMWDAETGIIDKWHNYCKKQMRDNFHPVDRSLIFANHKPEKTDYATKSLPYPLEAGKIEAWDKLTSTLYSPEERHKIEWGIGSVVVGDSKFIQKCFVLYGDPGTGKSTIFNIMQNLFEGYWSSFEARALGSASNIFAMESFRSNPRVAINHDGDLSRIEDNTRLNSIISHETMSMNEKHKQTYDIQLDTQLWIGTNKPVKITDAKSGLIRRVIDVIPTGDKLPRGEYKKVINQINFELGAIAYHCKEVYLDNPSAYDDYIPLNMMSATNDFYNFMFDNYLLFENENGVSLKSAWEMYNAYCEDSKVQYPLVKRIFKEELKNYFKDFYDRYCFEDGTRIRSYYSGFLTDKFEVSTPQKKEEKKEVDKPLHINFNSTSSMFDEDCADCMAQYANSNETPSFKWEKVTTKLSEIDTTKLHYVKVPENHIVIDFDIPDEHGNKSFERNLEAASHWPSTYAELSKSGAGIHLHYIYSGDATKLSRVYDDHIEIKVFTGNSSLRRRLSKCNNLPIATISSGLPLKEEIRKMISSEVIKSEKSLRTQIKRNLNKEIHPATKPSIDFIYKILEDTYNSGLHYDVTDMRNSVLAFAANSTNQSSYCIKLVNKMQFKSLEQSEPVPQKDDRIIFYDVEVFPNLFIVCWKLAGKDNPVIKMINPSPAQIEDLLRFKLIGFNNVSYDNHMIYARLMGYDNLQLYNLSKRIISDDKAMSRKAKFGEAYNLSHADIYDFCNNDNKMSLKKWEIKLGIHHQEMDLSWDEPVPQELWEKVAQYCCNDVVATEAVFNHPAVQADYTGRQILAEIAGMTVNDTTNKLTARIIFGTNTKPQSQFNYRDLGAISKNEEYYTFMEEPGDSMVPANPPIDIYGSDEVPYSYDLFDKQGRPRFPGYKFEYGVSSYRDVEVVGEGGRVSANCGIYRNVALLDVASMHPTSIIQEELFGPVYTAKFKELVDARLAIKHKDWDAARRMMDGKLTPFVQRVINGEISAKDLAYALKIAINSVYGLTSAKFENVFRDPRNKDNIVAKRGSLFMINLQHAVEERGYTVVHIKTDSIKIADADDYIIEFVMNYGELYGYTFEHEATYDRICLVNDAVYIAKYSDNTDINGDAAGTWTATGAQFQVPYVFKTLFSKEPIVFDDLCEVKQVKVGKMYVDMNDGLPDVSMYENILDLRRSKKKKTKAEIALLNEYAELSDDELYEKTKPGHNYIFVGKVGQFCPIKDEAGGGALCCIKEDRSVNSVTGTKGYKWMETEMVKVLGKEEDIDKSYYINLVDAAVASISEYGDFEMFVAN